MSAYEMTQYAALAKHFDMDNIVKIYDGAVARINNV